MVWGGGLKTDKCKIDGDRASVFDEFIDLYYILQYKNKHGLGSFYVFSKFPFVRKKVGS
jgi:hypothetical protein